MIDIELYDTINGLCPVQDYLDSLDNKLLAKTLRSIDLLKNNGTNLKLPFSKPLGDGLFELRTIQSTNITRILYFFYIGNKIILTNGFTKKTRKIPYKEIELARKYKRDYERRFHL